MAIRHLIAFVAVSSWASTGFAQLQAPPAGDPNAERVQQLERKLDAALQYIEGLRTELDALKRGAPPATPAATTAMRWRT